MENTYMIALVVGLIIFILVIIAMIFIKTNPNKDKKKGFKPIYIYVAGFIICVMAAILFTSLALLYCSTCFKEEDYNPPRSYIVDREYYYSE